ncbi:MAG: TlyA family RNA methyltransferase [Myxococcota bacterium]|nr:TlyA family RNA methyltransferase [Myxococcota bacterium]
MAKQRVDLMLVERGLAPSRERARALVLAGIVYSGERRIDKAGDVLVVDAPLEVRGADHPYVSRGGVKLEGALAALGVDPRGLVCADFGASTGGFTDCLLTRGAARVHAIDVGWGQLHPKLRNDPRVVVRERTNARHLRAADLDEAIDLVVIDASFIGLGKLLPAAQDVLRPGGAIVAMVKPQFEVGRRDLQKGVVRDPAARTAAIDKVEAEARALGLEVLGRCDSTLAGPEGNVEAFLHLRRALDQSPSPHGTTTSSR